MYKKIGFAIQIGTFEVSIALACAYFERIQQRATFKITARLKMKKRTLHIIQNSLCNDKISINRQGIVINNSR